MTFAAVAEFKKDSASSETKKNVNGTGNPDPSLETSVKKNPKQREFSERRHAMLFSGFALLNFFLFQLVLSLEFIQPVREQVYTIGSLFFSFLLFAVLYFCFSRLLVTAVGHLKLRCVSKEVCWSFGVFVLSAQVFYEVLFPQGLISSAALLGLFSVLFILSVDRLLELTFFQQILPIARRLPEDALLELEVQGKKKGHAKETNGAVQEDIPAARDRIANSELEPGDRFFVDAGELVPCDAVVLQGTCEIRERRMSGLARLSIKRVGDKVYAGSELVTGAIDCQVSARLKDSFITSFSDDIRGTLSQAPVMMPESLRIESIWNTTLLTIALVAGGFWASHGLHFPDLANLIASIVLISVFSRYLELVPLMRAIAVTQSFQKGYLIRRFSAYEALKNVQNWICSARADFAEPKRIKKISLLDNRVDRDTCFSLVLGLIDNLEPRLSASAHRQLRAEIEKDFKLLNFSEIRSYPGQGCSANVENTELSIGTEDFMLARGVQLQASDMSSLKEHQAELFVAIGEDVICSLILESEREFFIRALLPKFRKLGLSLAWYKSKEELSKSLGQVTRFASIGTSVDSKSEGLQEARCKIDVFDDLTWNTAESDIVMFSASSSLLYEFASYSKRWFRVRALQALLAFVLLPVLLLLSVLNLLSPAIVMLSCCMAALFFQFSTWLVVEVAS